MCATETVCSVMYICADDGICRTFTPNSRKKDRRNGDFVARCALGSDASDVLIERDVVCIT